MGFTRTLQVARVTRNPNSCEASSVDVTRGMKPLAIFNEATGSHSCRNNMRNMGPVRSDI